MDLKNLKPHKVVADLFNYRYVIAGRPKAGKTSLAYHIARLKFNGDMSKFLLAAMEKGYNALDGVYAVDINQWEDFQALVDQLIDERDELPFRVIGIDTVDLAVKYATDYILKTQSRKAGTKYATIGDIPYGKGYDLLADEMNKQFTRLDKAGYSLIFITHDKDQRFKTREGLEYDKTTLSLSGRIRDLILNMVDFIVFVEVGKEKDDEGNLVDKRWIYLRGDGTLEAGSRFANLPPKIEYSPEHFIEVIETAILESYGGDEKAVEKARKEQNKKKEEEVKKFIEEEKAKNSVDELHEIIHNAIKKLDQNKKIKVAKHLQRQYGNADYKTFTDVEVLEEILNYIDELDVDGSERF